MGMEVPCSFARQSHGDWKTLQPLLQLMVAMVLLPVLLAVRARLLVRQPECNRAQAAV